MRRRTKEIGVTRGIIRAFRKSQGWSASRLGRELANGLPRGYGRSYVKSIEGGSLPVSRFFREKFLRLVERVRGEQVNSKQILLRHGRFPKRLVIAGRIKRCAAGCGWHFVGASANQKYCSDGCRQHAKKALRSIPVGRRTSIRSSKGRRSKERSKETFTIA